MSLNEQPTIISISSTAKEQLETLRRHPPEYQTHIAGRIEAEIEAHVAPWTPRSERGGDGTIKWCEAISLHCNTDIYRLKSPEEIDQWRVFFFLLDFGIASHSSCRGDR
jgi:hypothetical protein